MTDFIPYNIDGTPHIKLADITPQTIQFITPKNEINPEKLGQSSPMFFKHSGKHPGAIIALGLLLLIAVILIVAYRRASHQPIKAGDKS